LNREAVQPLAAAIDGGDIPCRTTDTIEKDLWAKMLFNCTLNPLGAILDVPYGTLAEHESTRDLIGPDRGGDLRGIAGHGIPDPLDPAYRFPQGLLCPTRPDTALHRSSTLQDIRLGKRTEIEALNGAVIRLAHGMAGGPMQSGRVSPGPIFGDLRHKPSVKKVHPHPRKLLRLFPDHQVHRESS